MVLSTLQKYAERELTNAYLLELDYKDEFPHAVLEALYGDVGLHLLFIPEEFDGMGGGAYDIYRVSEVMAGIDLGIGTGVLATFLGSDPITVGGTPEQQANWMGRIAEEGILVAYGATEPQAGSDLGSLKTKAVPVVEDGKVVGYKISGRKQWISNGAVATLYTILANAPGGPTWFVVEKGAEGFSQGKPEDKHGIRASNTAALFLEEVYVPLDSLVGLVEGQGLVQAQAVFGYTRLMVAAFGLGEVDIAAAAAKGSAPDTNTDRMSPRWIEFMRFQIDRNRALYEEALPGVALLHADGRFAIGGAAELYRAILDDIEEHGYDVFSRRAHTDGWEKLRSLPGIWWRARLGYAGRQSAVGGPPEQP